MDVVIILHLQKWKPVSDCEVQTTISGKQQQSLRLLVTCSHGSFDSSSVGDELVLKTADSALNVDGSSKMRAVFNQ